MSFTPNIPASGQTLGNSRLQVLNNFASLRTTISNVTQPNHVDVNNSGAGKHTFVQMPVQIPGAANLPLANEGGLITETVSGKSELFYVRDAINTYYQMTGPTTISPNGTTMILGGIIIKWGNFGFGAGVGSEPVAFPTAFPNNFYSLSLLPNTTTPINGVGSISFGGTGSNSGFTAYRTNTTGIVTYFYIAIGN